jgi:hypothetical protein
MSDRADTLCHDCQSELDVRVPQYHGMPLFRGDFDETRCDNCGEVITP